jgi:carbamoyl-phosphate synthase large subunit
MDRKNILVTGIGGNVAQGVLRIINSLEHDIIVFGIDISDFTSGNHLCHKTFKVPYANKSSFIPTIVKLIEEYKIDLIIPTTDLEGLFLSKYKLEIPCNILISQHSLVKNCYDKYLTYKIFKKNKIDFVDTYLTSEYEIEKFENIILKPRSGRGSRGIHINPNDLSIFNDDYIVQELKIGKEITTSAYIDKKGNLISYISLERELENGTTVQTRFFDENQESLLEIIKKIMTLGKIKGSFNVQSIYDGEKYHPFEVNLRISGTNSIRHCYGFKDVEWGIKEYLYDELIDKTIIKINKKIVARRILMDVIYYENNEKELPNFSNSKIKIF